MAVTTKEQVAKLLGGNYTEASIASEWITWVEDMISDYTGVSYAAAPVTEKIDGKGTSTIFLSRRPVVSVTSVKVGDSTSGYVAYSASGYEVYAEGHIRLKAASWRDPLSLSPMATWPIGSKNIEVVYTAGAAPASRVTACATEMVATIARSSVDQLVATSGSRFNPQVTQYEKRAIELIRQDLTKLMELRLNRMNRIY